MQKRFLPFLITMFILASCAGTHLQTVPLTEANKQVEQSDISRLQKVPKPTPFPSTIYTPLPAGTRLRRSVLPPPFDPEKPVSALGNTPLLNTRASLAVPQRRSVESFAVAPGGDHEAEGVFLFGDAPPYDALFATQTAYEAVQRPLPMPSGAQGSEQIFAPTMHPAWSSCLENSSYYVSSTVNEGAHFTVFDFCLASADFIFDAPIDRTFLRDYVRFIGDGDFPSYVSEIFTPDRIPTATSEWYSVLYNFERHRYDLITSAKAIGVYEPAAFGWSIVEPYAAQGTCPQIAPALVTHLSAYNTSTSAWDAVRPAMANGAYTFIGLQGGSSNPCLLGDATGTASLEFTLISENNAWEVTSPRNP